MKKGMILVAKDTLVMSGTNALTRGKEYPIKNVRKDMNDFCIIDDQEDVRWFDFDGLDDFFTIDEPCDFQELFSFMSQTHGLILTQDEMWEIVAQVEKLQEKLKA